MDKIPMSRHPSHDPHPCLVCGTLTKWKAFCSQECMREYYKKKIWLDYILKEILRRGYISNQEFTTIAKKYMVRRMSRVRQYVACSDKIFPFYYLKRRIGYISKDFFEELKYRGIRFTYLHKAYPCIWSIHKKVFERIVIDHQEAIKNENIQEKDTFV